MLAGIKREFRLLYSSKEQSQNGRRITYLDMIRGIAIFLVVVGHSGLISHERNIWLSTFHLPAFFFVSGMLMQEKKEDEQDYIKIVLRKAKGIMLPYVWFSAGSLLVDAIQIWRGEFTKDILSEHFIQTITLQGYSVLWFLPVLFIAEVLVLFLYKIMKRCKLTSKYLYLAVFGISVCLAVAAYYVYQAALGANLPVLLTAEIRIVIKAVIAMGFVSGGGLVATALKKFGKKEKLSKEGFRAWLSDFNVIGLLLGGILSAINVLAVPYIQIMDFNNVNLGNPLVYLGLGFTGTMGVLFICRSISNIPLITFYGQNSLIVMCTHLNFYVLNAGMVIGRDVFVPLPGPDGLQFMISSIVCTMLLEIPVILLIRIFFPFVLGRGYKRSGSAEKKK
ncbi:MAG: acyltransferase [Lachnospiraceae bacterium]|nr:acyltransferase [Lachnospiraceae bacterium]